MTKIVPYIYNIQFSILGMITEESITLKLKGVTKNAQHFCIQTHPPPPLSGPATKKKTFFAASQRDLIIS